MPTTTCLRTDLLPPPQAPLGWRHYRDRGIRLADLHRDLPDTAPARRSAGVELALACARIRALEPVPVYGVTALLAGYAAAGGPGVMPGGSAGR